MRRAEDPVLLEQVFNDRLLLLVDPAGEDTEEEGERGRQRVHDGSLPEERPRFNGCEIGGILGRQIGRGSRGTRLLDGVDTPIFRRSVLGRVFAQDGGLIGPRTDGGHHPVPESRHRLDIRGLLGVVAEQTT